MTRLTSDNISQLLIEWNGGDDEALRQLMPLVYDELRRRAHHLMRRERPGHMLQTTALVNEVFLKLTDQYRATWKNRAQFFAISARMMRFILIGEVRRRQRRKRGGGQCDVSLDEAAIASKERAEPLIALDEALQRLAELDPKKGKIVELGFFGGMTWDETAEVLQMSRATVEREWKAARAWLFRQLKDADEDGEVPRSKIV